MKTNREVHEEAAGMGLAPQFFTFNKINPDDPYIKSYSAISSTQIRTYCPRCKRRKAQIERVDYGKGGVILFCECGYQHDEKEVKGVE